MEIGQDNTGLLGPVPGGFQGAVRRRNLGTLPLEVSSGSNEINPWWTDPKVMTAINSEAVFIANLYRSMTGQPPLPPQSTAPSVNIGLNPEAKTMLIIGGGLLAVLLLAKRR